MGTVLLSGTETGVTSQVEGHLSERGQTKVPTETVVRFSTTFRCKHKTNSDRTSTGRIFRCETFEMVLKTET